MNSDDIFAMEKLPSDIIVLGGGYIAVEMAQILNSLGVKTTIVIRSSPLKIIDKEVVEVLLQEMRKAGITVMQKTPHTKVEKQPDGNLIVHLKDGNKIRAEKVLTAIGRPPCTNGLGLEKTGVEL